VTVSAGDWDRASELIEQAAAKGGTVCLTCHMFPDGDALGSMLAFGLGLRQLGVDCVASFGDPFVIPSNLRFLPGQEILVPPAAFPREPELMISFDAAKVERLGSLAPAADPDRLIVIDHHASNTGFGSVNLVDARAAATAVLTERLLSRLGVALTADIALGLYAGLASDTGSFRYASTTAEVHGLAGRLVEAGVRPDAVSRELWERVPFGYLKVLSAALERARFEPGAAGDLGVIWTTVSRTDRAAFELPYDLLEGVIDVIRRCDDAEVAVVFKETDDGAWYVSTRAKGAVDVGRACGALGGGGHPLAAAFTSRADPSDTLAELLRLLAASTFDASMEAAS
jgi:phosphoesterase RecJ-like protein